MGNRKAPRYPSDFQLVNLDMTPQGTVATVELTADDDFAIRRYERDGAPTFELPVTSEMKLFSSDSQLRANERSVAFISELRERTKFGNTSIELTGESGNMYVVMLDANGLVRWVRVLENYAALPDLAVTADDGAFAVSFEDFELRLYRFAP